MKPGDYVLNLIRDASEERRTIALIRHSKRESFDGVPGELRNAIEITDEGIVMARELGESMSQISHINRLLLGHTKAKRAKMTAQSIYDGYFSDNQATIIGCEPEIRSPLVNFENLVAVRKELGWKNLIIKWLNEELPPDTLRNPHEYTDEIMGKLLHYPGVGSGELLVFVAHDITLFPMISSLFGKDVKAVDFLNGIVISADTNHAEVSFDDGTYSFSTERRIL
jgi:hypothetical protein